MSWGGPSQILANGLGLYYKLWHVKRYLNISHFYVTCDLFQYLQRQKEQQRE